jgi:hypothetical protein
VYGANSFSLLSLFLTYVLLAYRCSSFMGLDHQSPKRISLRAFSNAPLFLFLLFHLDMENSLDSSQDCISLLPVSLCDVLIVSYIHKFAYLVTGSSLLCPTCSIASSLTIQEKHARKFTRLVLFILLKASSHHPSIQDPSGSGYVESSRVRM